MTVEAHVVFDKANHFARVRAHCIDEKHDEDEIERENDRVENGQSGHHAPVETNRLVQVDFLLASRRCVQT